jgi:hypothetical protein
VWKGDEVMNPPEIELPTRRSDLAPVQISAELWAMGASGFPAETWAAACRAREDELIASLQSLAEANAKLDELYNSRLWSRAVSAESRIRELESELEAECFQRGLIVGEAMARAEDAESENLHLREGWISVEERLPEVDDEGNSRKVPIQDKGGSIQLCHLRVSASSKKPYWIGNYERGVVRWFDLPLPAPVAALAPKETASLVLEGM